MNYVKNLACSQLRVDVKHGRVWLNAPNCVLRIQGVKFDLKDQEKENFSTVDIHAEDAVGVLLQDEEPINKELSQFLVDMTNMISSELSNNPKILNKEKFLEIIMHSARKTIESDYR